MKKIFLLTILGISLVLSGAVIKESKQDEDIKIIVNDGGVMTEAVTVKASEGSQLQVDKITDKAGTGAPSFPQNITTGTACSTGNVCSGTYTPTSSNVSGGTLVSLSDAQYFRVGNVVTVSGNFEFDPTVAGSTISFRLSIPISTSNFSDALQAGGSGGSNNSRVLWVSSVSGYTRVKLSGQWAYDGGTDAGSYSYTYLIP